MQRGLPETLPEIRGSKSLLSSGFGFRAEAPSLFMNFFLNFFLSDLHAGTDDPAGSDNGVFSWKKGIRVIRESKWEIIRL